MLIDPITKEVYKRAFPALASFKSVLLLDHTLDEMQPQINHLKEKGELQEYLNSNTLLSELRELQLTNNTRLKQDVLSSCLDLVTANETYINEYLDSLLSMLTSHFDDKS